LQQFKYQFTIFLCVGDAVLAIGLQVLEKSREGCGVIIPIPTPIAIGVVDKYQIPRVFSFMIWNLSLGAFKCAK